MTTKNLSQTADLNLEFYRKQAKALLRAPCSGDANAKARLRRFGVAGEPALHAAPMAIGREQGFKSWPRFHAFITETNLDFCARVDRFIDEAVSDGRRARDILAEHGNIAVVEARLDAGVPIDSRGDMVETALHQACWRGNVALLKTLLTRGAPLDEKEATYGAPPAGWLHHGATNYGHGDYAEGTRLLIAAGVKDWDAPNGNQAMDSVLREHGLIA